MVVIDIDTDTIALFLSVVLRFSIPLFLLPFLDGKFIPARVKAGLALSLSVALFPMVSGSVKPLDFHPASLAMVVVGEIFFGVIMGLLIKIVMEAFQLGAHALEFQMGFGFARVADPMTGVQLGVTGQLMNMIAMLLLFAINGHLLMLNAIIDSFHAVPLGGFVPTKQMIDSTIVLTSRMFVIAIRLVAPIMFTLLLVKVGVGIISKFSPQLNVLMVSFPVTILVGVAFLSLFAPTWGYLMEKLFREVLEYLHAMGV